MIDRRRLVPWLLLTALVVLGALSSIPAAADASPPCVVLDGRVTYPTLQEGIDGASAGSTLTVQGTCYGDASVGKNLRIVGRSNHRLGAATLDGANSPANPGSVIVDHGATVVIRAITITGGYNGICAPADGPECAGAPGGSLESTAEKGGGIFNEGGSVTLIDSTVSGNVAAPGSQVPSIETFGGGGIYNDAGSVTLENSTVAHNEGLGKGGGIDNEEGSLTLDGSTVTENRTIGTARGIGGEFCDPGGGIYNTGQASLEASTVSGNRGGGQFCGGGGISNGGSFTLDRSIVKDNEAYEGGGIFNEGSGSLTLERSTVTGNIGETQTALGSTGGGIANAGTLTLDNSTVNANTASKGGGIYNGGGLNGGGSEAPSSLALNGSTSVIENRASEHGGGIFNVETGGATITFGNKWRGTISGNEPDDIFNA